MEQGSERQGAKMRTLEFERRVRMEALSGCQQIKTVENRIRDAPEGGLLGLADGEDSKALRTTILNASATIVEKFSKVIRLLSSAPNASRSPNLTSARGLRAQEQQLAARAGALNLDGDSPLLSPEDPHTPGRMQMSSPSASPCHTPHSGSGMSEGSPGRPNHVALDSDEDMAINGGNPARRRSHETSAAAAQDPELSDKPALPKKRKYLPKYQMKQRAISTGDPANDGPPDDGYTWRKYGQKDIKESSYPRSYYRCTHKTDLGCPSIKMVQRSDEDPNYYDVTYRGHHICPSVEQRTWQFGLAPSHIAIHELLASDSKGPSPAVVMGGGALHLGTPGQTQDSVNVGTGHSPTPFSFPKSTSGLTAPPSSHSNRKSSPAPVTTTGSSTTTAPDLNQIVATRFAPNPPSTMAQEHSIPMKFPPSIASAPPLDQVAFSDSRLARDSLFGPGSNLMHLLLGRGGEGGSMDLELEDLSLEQIQQQVQRETTASGGGGIERTHHVGRGESLHRMPMASTDAGSQASSEHYMDRWPESGTLMSFQSEESSRSIYMRSSGASAEAVTSQAQQIRPTALVVSYSNSTLANFAGPEMYHNIPAQSETSEAISSASPSPFSLGMPSYIIDGPGPHQQMYVDYEFGNTMYYESSHTD